MVFMLKPAKPQSTHSPRHAQAQRFSRLLRGASVLALSWLPFLGACTISLPFKYPEPVGTGSPEDRLLVSVTHAKLHPDKRAAFDEQTMVVFNAMAHHPGVVAYAIRRELFGNQVWTVSVWRDDASRMKFFMSEVHQRAIYMSEDAIETVRYKRVTIQRSELPLSWGRALALLAESEKPQKP